MKDMTALVEYIAKSLVDDPDAVAVEGRDDGRTLELRVAEDDRGKVIGKRGRTAHAIRSLLTVAGGDSEPVSLDIID